MSDAVADVTPPALHGPSGKERKYDRQLRLWAANGQAALEQAHVLLLNNGGAGVAGVEALKNLVLPGVGRFTICDASNVAERDLGVDFFLTEDDLGASRAERSAGWLNELNPDVRGEHIQPASLDDLRTKIASPGFLEPYTIIIAALPAPTDVVSALSRHANSHAIPVFYVESIGFYSEFTLELAPAFPIVDTHPDPVTTTDLRLAQPWPALTEFMHEKTANMEAMSDEQHGHVPYLLILLHYLEKWRETHNGQIPTEYKQKSEFRELVRSGMRTNTTDGSEENFEEAIAAVLKSVGAATLSGDVKEVFTAPECQNLTQKSPDFWIIANAVSAFHRQHDALPLPGGLPDMKAKSADYVKLQGIYKAKARADVADVLDRVKTTSAQLHRTKHVDLKDVEAFCKSAGYIKLVRGRPQKLIFDATSNSPAFGDRARFATNSLASETSLMPLHLCFMAYNHYLNSASNDRHAGEMQFPLFPDLDEAISHIARGARIIANDIIAQSDGDLEHDRDVVGESEEHAQLRDAIRRIATDLVCAQGGELHNIAALTGGMVAQEAIKVITRQYVPIDNTCLFDGVKSRTSVLRL